MIKTKDNDRLQRAGLCAILLVGDYGLCGQIMANSCGDLLTAWLTATIAAGLIWAAASVIPRPRCSAKHGELINHAAVFYFALMACLYLRGTALLWRQWAFPTSSVLLPALSLSLLAVYGGRRGLRPLLRLTLPVMTALFFFFLLDTAFLIPEMSFRRLALSSAGFDSILTLRLTGALLLPLPAALLLSPGSGDSPAGLSRVGLISGLLYLLLTALRSLLLLGRLTVWEPFPLLRSLMLVGVGPGLSRMDCWGLLALSGAMTTAVMLFAAGLLARIGEQRHCRLTAAAVAAFLTVCAFF